MRIGPSGTLWRALDETLERPVQVTVFDPALPRTADVLDAARRVTLAKDHRLAQVLDVGQDGEIAFVVSESLPGRTLAQAVSGDPLPAVEARRLVGETAEALSGAADRGLHHQRLTPETLVVGSDGSVKLTGTAVEAAATGWEARNSTVASRVDALGLVCVLYAALTGLWPGTAPSDLPAAPRVGGRTVPPGDLVPGIPADLDELCVQALSNAQDAPATPAEVAERLAPWPGAHPLTDPRGLLVTNPTDPGSSSVASPATSISTPAGADDRTRDSDRTRDKAPVAGSPPVDTGPTAKARPAAAPQAVPPSTAALTAAAAALSRIRRAQAAGSGATSDVGGTGPDIATPPSSIRPTCEAAPADREKEPVAITRSAPATSTGTSTGTSTAGPHRLPRSLQNLFEPLRQPSPSPEDTLARGSFQGWDDLSTIGQPVIDDEPLVPFGQVPEAPGPPGSESRFVIAVVTGFVVFVVGIAMISLRTLESPAMLLPKDVADPLPTATASASSTTPTTPSVATTSSPATPPVATPSASPQLVGAQAIDPQGDGQENDNQASRVVDGDPSTAWKSQRYQTSGFGGLKKGLGLVLSLGAGDVPEIQQVMVDVAGSGGTVELRTTAAPGLDGSTVVAKAPIRGGRAVLTPTKPVKSQLLLLWFTKLPKTDGKYQLIVSEADVR